MATQLFLLWGGGSNPYAGAAWSDCQAYTNIGGSSYENWETSPLKTARGSGLVNTWTATVTGPTNGLEFAPTNPWVWISPPLAADTTISGSITFNMWAYESSMNANAAINCQVFRIKASDWTWVQICKTANTTELGLTTFAVNNWTATPTSTNFTRGDRIAVVPFIDDAGTMATGYSAYLSYNSSSAGVSGDTYVTFNETFSFESTPSGTTVYPTTTSILSTGDREAWTSRGSGATTSVTNTVAGPTSAIQVTATGGGQALQWFTKTLAAVTLEGPILVNLRWADSDINTSHIPYCEIHITDGDGSNPVLWAKGADTDQGTMTTSETAQQFWMEGSSVSVAQGKRIRFRMYLEDKAGNLEGATAGNMTTAKTGTMWYAGTSGGASGDTYLTFPVTLTYYDPGESSSGDPMPYVGGGYYS